MKETSKAHPIRVLNGDFELYLRGYGIDIGAGDDPLRPPNGTVRAWDTQDGNAQMLPGIPLESFDFVYSSHCLEHVRSVPSAIAVWASVCRPGGFVYVVVPEWTVYEHRQWPSLHNRRHRSTFGLISAPPTNHPHYTLADMIPIGRVANLDLIDVRLDMEGFNFSQHTLRPPFTDQTRQGAQAQITFVWRKLSTATAPSS